MNIDDYIRVTKRNIYALKPECLEDDYALECLSTLASSVDASIIVKPIFSTSIFPELSKILFVIFQCSFFHQKNTQKYTLSPSLTILGNNIVPEQAYKPLGNAYQAYLLTHLKALARARTVVLGLFNGPFLLFIPEK